VIVQTRTDLFAVYWIFSRSKVESPDHIGYVYFLDGSSIQIRLKDSKNGTYKGRFRKGETRADSSSTAKEHVGPTSGIIFDIRSNTKGVLQEALRQEFFRAVEVALVVEHGPCVSQVNISGISILQRPNIQRLMKMTESLGYKTPLITSSSTIE
jgi:hypothetical protein